MSRRLIPTWKRLAREEAQPLHGRILGRIEYEADTWRSPLLNVQNLDTTTLVLSYAGLLCWAVCFWWMYRISSRQDALLKELRAMTKRIEKLSQSEHDLISEVHPQVNEIKEQVQNVREAVSAEN